ncbi:MAG: dihydrofolate reductase [Alphaproteobacteria bacterium]
MITSNDNIKNSLLVAMAQNRCIGRNNKLPWHISEDLKRFKALTIGHPVIMGRKTFESILGYLKKPLPERDNIIVTRNKNTLYPNSPIHQTSTIEQAIELGQDIAKKDGKKEIFIIGGGEIFTQSLALAHRIHLTKIHRDVAGDAFFPALDEADWETTETQDHKDNDPPYSFITLERRQYLL